MVVLPEWLRKIPHTNLKPCGGARADCSLMSQDDAEKLNWLQKAYWKHDKILQFAREKENEVKKMRKDADSQLAKELRAGDTSVLSFKEKFYLAKSKVIFR